MKLGIGIITYNRKNRVLATLSALLSQTTTPAVFVVADDGSTDGTPDAVRWSHDDIAVVGGENRGVCWNRNRALWYLHVVSKCDVTILIEDDTWPTQPRWECDWIEAAQAWGHANLDGAWFRDGSVGGSGTLRDPTIGQATSGQCSAFSREALDLVGFYDTRFRGYGSGHVEHTQRMIRAGFGGSMRDPIPESHEVFQRSAALVRVPPAPPRVFYWLLRSPLHVDDEGSYCSPENAHRAQMMLARTVRDTAHRMPWRTDVDMTAFRKEIDAAQRFNGAGQTPTSRVRAPLPSYSQISAAGVLG